MGSAGKVAHYQKMGSATFVRAHRQPEMSVACGPTVRKAGTTAGPIRAWSANDSHLVFLLDGVSGSVGLRVGWRFGILAMAIDWGPQNPG